LRECCNATGCVAAHHSKHVSTDTCIYVYITQQAITAINWYSSCSVCAGSRTVTLTRAPVPYTVTHQHHSQLPCTNMPKHPQHTHPTHRTHNYRASTVQPVAAPFATCCQHTACNCWPLWADIPQPYQAPALLPHSNGGCHPASVLHVTASPVGARTTALPRETLPASPKAAAHLPHRNVCQPAGREGCQARQPRHPSCSVLSSSRGGCPSLAAVGLLCCVLQDLVDGGALGGLGRGTVVTSSTWRPERSSGRGNNSSAGRAC
jgi:hypothetical protein